MFAARSTSASASTIIGSFPPSSSDTGVSVRAARSSTRLPVSVEPVNITMSTSSISACPASPSPAATRKTSSGRPDSRSASAISSDVSGVDCDGFSTAALPAASAGMQSPNEFVSG